MVRRHVLSTSSSDNYQNNPAFLLNIPSAEQNLLLKVTSVNNLKILTNNLLISKSHLENAKLAAK